MSEQAEAFGDEPKREEEADFVAFARAYKDAMRREANWFRCAMEAMKLLTPEQLTVLQEAVRARADSDDANAPAEAQTIDLMQRLRESLAARAATTKTEMK